MGKLWLGVRSVAMAVLFPGTVIGYLSYRILAPSRMPRPDEWTWDQYVAALIFTVGLGILLRSIWDFARLGKGTLAPFDEPRALVVQGLYRYVRNPMYVTLLLILLAESWFFWSSRLLVYAGIVFALANRYAPSTALNMSGTAGRSGAGCPAGLGGTPMRSREVPDGDDAPAS